MNKPNTFTAMRRLRQIERDLRDGSGGLFDIDEWRETFFVPIVEYIEDPNVRHIPTFMQEVMSEA